MLKRFRLYIVLGFALIATSAVLYLVHFAIFRDWQVIGVFGFLEVCFLPLEILIVTMFVGGALAYWERRSRLEKMNMVIGAFFSEVGTELLQRICSFATNSSVSAERFRINQDWRPADFARARKVAVFKPPEIDPHAGDLLGLRDFLLGRRDFMLRLLENPNLLEHESFTDLLWAVHHMTEELAFRGSLEGLPDTDYAHMANDMVRAHGLMVSEWLTYMEHLQAAYPFLYSLAVRTNPFNPDATPVISA
ncbi:MAG: hypothetical protein ACYC55_09215 [Candidatus Geothermincolia bacterium]